MDASFVEDVLGDFLLFLNAASLRESGATIECIEETLLKLEWYHEHISFIMAKIEEFLLPTGNNLDREAGREDDEAIFDFLSTLNDVFTHLRIIKDRWYDLEAGVSIASPGENLKIEKDTSSRGRPKYIIKKEQLLFLRELRFTWTMIASMYGVSRRTMYNIRSRHGLTSCEFTRFTCISDEDLTSLIRDIKKEMPDLGQTITKGVLESKGIHVPTTRIRECLLQVDPINTTLRWSPYISRRVYCVPRPNSLWHIDGNHKLIRWRFIVHGGIDGFSRFIIYLRCSTNNKSSTVFDVFHNAVMEYGIPDRIRSDKGGENIKVAEYMLLHGHVANPFITGSSVHNQRIERLWRDTFRCVLSLYYQLFYYLEDHGCLDPDSETDLFCLHLVYKDRINRTLESFSHGWNNHAITTENNMSPTQLFTCGYIFSEDIVHHESPVPDFDTATANLNIESVVIPPTNNPMTVEQSRELSLIVNSAQLDANDYGIETYKTVRSVVTNYLH